MMSDKQTGQASQRKASNNKNIKKLRAISMVCSLTSNWQQWVTDNEKKQASEPTGWFPSTLGGPTQEPKKKWVPRKSPQAPTSQTGISEVQVVSPGDAPKPSAPHKVIQDAPKSEVKTPAEPAVGSPIKVKPVVKTVTSGAQEKGAGISLLTEKIKKEPLPSDDDIDRLLKKKSSPTRRRKCSNMVSSLTKSWKQMEKEHKPAKEEVGRESSRVCDDGDNRGLSEKEKDRAAEADAGERDSEGDSESALKIKRPSVPV